MRERYLIDHSGRLSLRKISSRKLEKHYLRSPEPVYVYRKSHWNGIYFQRSQTDPRMALRKYRRSGRKAYVYIRIPEEEKKSIVVAIHAYFQKIGEYQQSPFPEIAGLYNLPVKYADVDRISSETEIKTVKGSYSHEWANALVSAVLSDLQDHGYRIWRMAESIEDVFSDDAYFSEIDRDKQYGNKLGAGWARKKTRMFLSLDDLLKQLRADMEDEENE